MILSTSCKSCGVTIENKYMVSDRMSMVKAYGEELNVTCLDCGAENTYHVDEFKAESNVKLYRLLLTITLGLSALIVLIFYFFYVINGLLGWLIAGIIVLLPFIVLLFYLKFDNDSQSQFNRIKLRGRIVDSKLTSTSSKVDIVQVSNTKSHLSAIKKHNKAHLPSNKKES